MIRALVIVCLIATLLPAQEETVDQELPYPRGSSSQEHSGLRFQLVLPADYDPAEEYSLVVILHGAGGTETGMAGSLRELTEDGFVVCAPKSTGPTWNDPDIKSVREITRHLLDVLSIGAGRLHGAGFSNGGWNLAPLAFAEDLPFVSACWIAAGYKGHKVPRDAKERMGCIALAGAQDANRAAAEGTVGLLEKKVRSVEVHLQPDLGHEWPGELMPYYFWWLQVMEGRIVPGDDRSFDWTDDLEAARGRMESEKRAGLVYFYSAADVDLKEARYFQQTVLFDRLVRHFGRQCVAIKLDRSEHEELFTELKLKKTPAVAIVRPSFKKLKSLQGRINPVALGKLLRAVAPDPSLPDWPARGGPGTAVHPCGVL